MTALEFLSSGWALITSDTSIAALSTLLASFLGAYFAFRLESNQKTKEAVEKNLAAGNRAMMALARMYSVLAQVQRDLIDPHRGSAVAFIAMKPYVSRNVDSERFDFSALEFLSSPTEQQLVLDLWQEERRFHHAMAELEQRSNFHLQDVQPALEAAGFKQGHPATIAQVEAALGDRRSAYLRQATESVVSSVDSSVVSLRAVADQLKEQLGRRFPKQVVLDFARVDM